MLKKKVIFFIIIIVVIATAVIYYIGNYQMQLNELKKINSNYELYYDKEILGTDIISIINKTMDWNEQNDIPKNEKGEYQENDTNSIIITVKFKGIEDQEFIYRMEAIAKQGSVEFVKNFGGITFKCTNIEYHEKSKMIKSLFIEQM